MTMRLIDIFKVPDQNNSKLGHPVQLYAWLFDDSEGNYLAGCNRFLACNFHPRIYVQASIHELIRLKRLLAGYRIDGCLEQRKTIHGIKTVLAMDTEIGTARSVIKDLDALSKYSYEILNADIPVEEHYLFLNQVFPTGSVNINLDKAGRITIMHPYEEPTADFDLPPLSSARLCVETSYSLRKDLNPDLLAITFDGTRLSRADGETTDTMIAWLMSAFRDKDPDIIITQDGNLELPYLLDVIRRYEPSFSFSRFGTDCFSVGGKSHESYGRILYKQMPCYFKGRLHFQEHGVMYGAWSLDHPFTLARLCRTTVQRANHRSPGYCASNLQMYHAIQKGFLIPHRRSCVEVWKSGMELFNADRGSLIYEPRIGWHTDVAELDFVSLFPNIMVKHNISTETLFCRCCRTNKVPGLGINICTRERGVIPDMLEPLITARLQYKSQGSTARADALKGVLVTSFGYMGFRKSKFARIEAHQAIQAYARETLLCAAKTAEEHGFTVLHGIVDSLWVHKMGMKRPELEALMTTIQEKTGIAIKLEGRYRWIVFLPSTQHPDVPVPTRYYGVFENGELKLRGIEARRHDTPLIITKLQLAIISELALAKTFDEFIQIMKAACADVDGTIEQIFAGQARQEELVFTKGISKEVYTSHIPQSIALKKLKKAGFAPKPGQYIQYVITDKHSKIVENRYGIAGKDERCMYDRAEYVRLAKEAVQHLWKPFENKIQEKQITIGDAMTDKMIKVGAKIS